MPEQEVPAQLAPATDGPSFRIDTTDSRLVASLNELRGKLRAEFEKDWEWRAPEQSMDYAFYYVPVVLDELLEKGEVLLWDASRKAPGYPTLGYGFDYLCNCIREIEGVLLLTP